MPPRSVKMKRFIFGFQRRVWWPKWAPASSNCFMETTGMGAPFYGSIALHRWRQGGSRTSTGHRPPWKSTGSEDRQHRQDSRERHLFGPRSRRQPGSDVRGGERGRQIVRQLGAGLDPLAGERVREGEL